MPSRLPYKPDQKTRPVVDGPQMAHVVGPEGEEIYTDEYGRVKVSFPWNRHCQKNEKSSCWIRVAQNWAGAKWGHIAIPRIGQEVIVDFLEGDIDQPIITGRTYHAVNQVPYKLPDHKTKMVIRSDTHKGEGYNEISFEDEAGREEVFVQAEKDMHVGVKNNYAQFTNSNHHQQIGANETRVVIGWADFYYNQNLSISTGRNLFQTVGNIGAMPMFLGQRFVDRKHFQLPYGMLALGTDLDNSHTQGSMITAVEGDIVTTTQANFTLHAAGNSHQTFEGGYSLGTPKDFKISANLNGILSAGNGFVVSAGKALVLKCGKSSITMNEDGLVQIRGTKIKLN